MARSCIFFFSGGFVGRPATDHGNAMVPFLLHRIRRSHHRDDDFDHTDLGDAFGDLRCPDSEAKTLYGPLKETLKKMAIIPKEKIILDPF